MTWLEWTIILGSILQRKRLLKSGESFVLTFGSGVRMRDVPGRAQLLHSWSPLHPQKSANARFIFSNTKKHTTRMKHEAPHEYS
jgi:hypothetical protein